MEGYLWLYIFPLAVLPWWWRINHPSCLFPEWCSAVLLNTTASLNLNVRSASAAAQDKANQHQMPPRWTYCLALESLTLSLLLINIIQPNPRVHFSQTTVKPSWGPCEPCEARGGRRGGGRQSLTSGAQHTKPPRWLRSPSIRPPPPRGQHPFWSTRPLFTYWNPPVWCNRDYLEWNLPVFQRPHKIWRDICAHSWLNSISFRCSPVPTLTSSLHVQNGA